ncbi:hypothetical protein PU630_00080 [Microbacterium horticulturae]|uniref:Uncharacterized protein n=1 Tax=Microbacterium horticulturae TaxID=3028316 RepID=A0ABY8BXS0_9MICO|nr:hypothetical protein [Microbacterium sp. KACC 23027]WEG08996.1 hypothetical protein PU630_00080 [Microbacterium sp. KACC 23027]
MSELVGEILRWGVPALVVVVIAGILVVAVAWAVRAARRSPRAKAAADAARATAGSELVRLDDAVAELDLEVGLSGALYGGDAPTSLRRARMTAQHVRDDAFEVFRTISDDPTLLPVEVQRRARLISARVTEAMAAITHASGEHEAWMQANTSAADQVAAARRRLADLREQMGDPDALVAQLRSEYDESEWGDAAAAAAAASHHAAEASALLDRAAASAGDPSRSALSDLALAERRIRSAQIEARRLDEVHGFIAQAVQSLPDEFAAVRAALRQAMTVREGLEPTAAERLGDAIREAESALTRWEKDAARRPTQAVDGVARLRDRLDLALGDARTSQQRLRGARTALTGTIAAAQSAVARAEASAAGAGADARVRLASARDELADARRLPDPVEALDAARRAMRHAEDAQALATYDRMTSGR